MGSDLLHLRLPATRRQPLRSGAGRSAGAVRPIGPGGPIAIALWLFRYVIVTAARQYDKLSSGRHVVRPALRATLRPMIRADTIRDAPKVLLHDHLDGGLRPATVIDLAREFGYAGLPTTDPDELGRCVHRGRRSQEPGALPRGLRAHRRRDADARRDRARRLRVRRGPGGRRRGLRRGALRARAEHARRPVARRRRSRRSCAASPAASARRASGWASSSRPCASSRARSRSPSSPSATATRASSASTWPGPRPAIRRRATWTRSTSSIRPTST